MKQLRHRRPDRTIFATLLGCLASILILGCERQPTETKETQELNERVRAMVDALSAPGVPDQERARVREHFKVLGDSAVPELRRLAVSAKRETVIFASGALTLVGTEQAIATLVELLTYKPPFRVSELWTEDIKTSNMPLHYLHHVFSDASAFADYTDSLRSELADQIAELLRRDSLSPHERERAKELQASIATYENKK